MLDMDWLEIYKSVLKMRLNEEFPNIDNDYFTKEDIAIQSIYEGIKDAYYKESDRIKTKDRLYEPVMKIQSRTDISQQDKNTKISTVEDTIGSYERDFNRNRKIADKYRQEKQDEIYNERGVLINDLSPRDISTIEKRLEGAKFNDLEYAEINDINKIKLISGMVKGSFWNKQFRPYEFRDLMDDYEYNVSNMQGDIFLRTHRLFDLEWNYNVDFIYEIASEAEKRDIKTIDCKNLIGLMGDITIYSNGAINNHSRFLMFRNKLISLVFEDDLEVRNKLYQAFEALEYLKTICQVPLQIEVNTDAAMRERFITNDYNLFNMRNQNKDWTNKKVRVARQIYNDMYKH